MMCTCVWVLGLYVLFPWFGAGGFSTSRKRFRCGVCGCWSVLSSLLVLFCFLQKEVHPQVRHIPHCFLDIVNQFSLNWWFGWVV